MLLPACKAAHGSATQTHNLTWRLARALKLCRRNRRPHLLQGPPDGAAHLTSTTSDLSGISKSCSETSDVVAHLLTFVVALDLVDGPKGPKLAFEFKLADVC